jgi:hypothetical protein
MQALTLCPHPKSIPMTTQEIAGRFYELALEGRFAEIHTELFDPGAISIEPSNGLLQSVVGLDAIEEKGRAWNENVKEIHSAYTSEPRIAGNYFVCTMGMDVTRKDRNRIRMDEVAVYEVEDGKIVREQFFY